MANTEPLVDDGAPFRCGAITGWDAVRDSDTCDKKATLFLTNEFWILNQDKFAFRAVCDSHAVLAEIMN